MILRCVPFLAYINDSLAHPASDPRLPRLIVLVPRERVLVILNHIPLLVLRGQLNVYELVEPLQVRRYDRVVSLIDLIEKLSQGQSISFRVVEGHKNFPKSKKIIF